ncbi:MAG: hypothetical protein K9M55_03225 [Candidatus Marinimicrobia bacterium]|nr:hypothetical protein [Candidatus Neomarinimicrobiota bacterium]MCF7921692.1 hypothetical protein [Candidatus Neomarinimicrobiota bacterium]
MKFTKVVIIILAALLLFGCAKVMLKAGGLVAGFMQEKTGDVSDATAFIKLNNVNRGRPWTAVEIEYLTDKGWDLEPTPSNTWIMFSRGMKFLEIDGSVTCNGAPMKFYGNGMYLSKQDVKPGATYAFEINGSAGAPVQFTETYYGEKITITKPAEGDEVDLSKGFQLEWTPGADTSKIIKLSMLLTQIGLQNVLPIYLMEDDGSEFISPEILGESIGPAQKFQAGPNMIMLERHKDVVRNIMNGDVVVSSVDTDVIQVTVTGSVKSAHGDNNPYIPAIAETVGDVTVTIAPTRAVYNPGSGALADISKIKKIGLSSFVFRGKTELTKVKETSTTITTTTWGYDFGVPTLTRLADNMADDFMVTLTKGFKAEEVPKEAFINNPSYKRMASGTGTSGPYNFFVTARNLANFDMWENYKVKFGGLESWYYDMIKSSGADALAECYIKAQRIEPEEGASGSTFTFNVTISVAFKAYQGNIVMASYIPGANAVYKSETLEITKDTTYEEFLKAFKVENFMLAYATALDKWVDAYNTLEI